MASSCHYRRMPELQRRLEYERFFTKPSLGGHVLRWALGPAGQWVINTPLMRIPEELRMRRAQRWLDVGCGRGSLLSFVDERVHFERSPVGVDFSAAALRLAREDSRDGRPALACATATALPFAHNTFDLVTCGYMLKHLTDEELAAFMGEVRRVLVGGGVALLWDYAPSGSEALDGWNRGLLGAGVHEPRLRSTRSLVGSARAAGFELARDARLRPFLIPPIPRASIFIGKAPEGWSAPH
jgi:SAM-dependent methyltransferase